MGSGWCHRPATGPGCAVTLAWRQPGEHGLRTVRDALRWHLIGATPDRYDFSGFRGMAKAPEQAGTQVIRDLMHYGWPDDLDIWGAAFVHRFARYAAAAARAYREMTDTVPFWCPVNEISFLARGGGDARYLNPFAQGRGFELKVQLARASIAAMHALRAVDPRARFVHCEPAIAVHRDPGRDRPYLEAEGWHQAQVQAFELIMGRRWPQIGGDPSFLDIVGMNYYSNNQWIHAGPPIDVDSPFYRPLSDLVFENYGRPVLISGTGIENDRRGGWFRHVASEVARARKRGVQAGGICIYPILDHLGWDNDRLCRNGLLSHKSLNGRREGGGWPPQIVGAACSLSILGCGVVAMSPSRSTGLTMVPVQTRRLRSASVQCAACPATVCIYKVYAYRGVIMRKHQSHGKDKKKSSQLVIRLDKAERDAFVTLCDQLDTSAAREIRRFMREFVATHASEDPVADDKSASIATPDAIIEAPEDQGARSQQSDTQADVPSGATEIPKTKPKRVRP